MANALRLWSPLHEMERFRRDFDDLFDRFLSGGHVSSLFTSGPFVESYFEGDNLIVRADLPGVDPKDVEVTVNGDVLTLRGTRSERAEDKGRGYLHREVSYGSFERAVTLPKGVKSDQIKAAFKNGVLELTIPATPELVGRKIPISIEDGSGKNNK